MALPERLYYPLDKAIKRINSELTEKEHIDLDDIFHFAMLGKLELCFHLKVNGATFDDSGDPIIERPIFDFYVRDSQDLEKANKFADFYYNQFGKNFCQTKYGEFNIDGLDLIREENGIAITVSDANILLALPKIAKFMSTDYILSKGLSFAHANIPRSTNIKIGGKDSIEFDIPVIFSFRQALKRQVKDLYITHDELEIFKQGGKDLPEVIEPETKSITRVSSKFKDAFFLLLKESGCYTDQPHSLYNILNAVAVKHGYPEDHFKEDTCAKWLKECNPK